MRRPTDSSDDELPPGITITSAPAQASGGTESWYKKRVYEALDLEEISVPGELTENLPTKESTKYYAMQRIKLDLGTLRATCGHLIVLFCSSLKALGPVFANIRS
jgi:hypothetical protein